MELDAIEKKLAHIESRFYSDEVKSIDDHGQEFWIKGSGLEFMRTVLKAKRALGKEVLPEESPGRSKALEQGRITCLWAVVYGQGICRGLVNKSR